MADPKEYHETCYNTTINDDGSWTLSGVWVIDEFVKKVHKAKSGNFPVIDDIEMYITFLNPLKRTQTRISAIVFFNKLKCQYPMDLTVRMINYLDDAKTKNNEKTTHVIYSPTALRSYMDFTVIWDDVVKEEEGFIDLETGQLRIEFEFTHTLKPFEINSQHLADFIQQQNQAANADNSFEETKNVGLFTREFNDVINGLLIGYYQIPVLRRLVYKTNSTEPIAISFQRMFSQLQTSHKSFASKEFLQAIQWEAPEKFHPNIVERSINEIYNGWSKILDNEEFFKFVGIQISKRYIDVETQQDVQPPENGVLNSIYVTPHDQKTLDDLLQNNNLYNAGSIIFDSDDSKFHTTTIKKLPIIIMVEIRRFSINNGQIVENRDDLQIPLDYNFNRLLPEGEQGEQTMWSLKAIINTVSDSDKGRFDLYERIDNDGVDWLKFSSGKVTKEKDTTVLEKDLLRPVVLLYTLKSEVQTLYVDVADTEIPEAIRIMTPNYEANGFQLTIMTEGDYGENCLHRQLGCGTKSTEPRLNVQSAQPVSQLISTLAQSKGAKPEQIRLWSVSSDGHIRDIITPDKTCKEFEKTKYAFVQYLKDTEKAVVLETEVAIFLKVYHPQYEIRFLGSATVERNTKVSRLINIFKEYLSADDFQLLIFKENNDFSATYLDGEQTLESLHINNGDCLICQIDPQTSEIDNITFFYDFSPELKAPTKPLPAFKEYLPEDEPFPSYTEDEKPETVDTFLDLKYHHNVVLAICDYNEPEVVPELFLSVPLSIPMKRLKDNLSMYYSNESEEFVFYLQKPDSPEPNDTPVDTSKPNLKDEFMKIKTYQERAVNVYAARQ